ncbi:MAG: pentapeptide repeat-containing protein [Dehalococcoidia bacterium]
MPSPDPDHYAILGVARTASVMEVRAAYRKLAREHHPDANPDPEAEARMRRINQAWETLRDTERRSTYDRTLPSLRRPVARPMRAQRPPAPPRPHAQRDPFQRDPFRGEDAPRRAPEADVEYTGDPSINWYREIGVREDAPRQEILKALSRMAGNLNGADISATEFTRKRNQMREAWAVLGDQHMRAAYDRARKQARQAPAPQPDEPAPPAPPPAGYRVGPIIINGVSIDKGAQLPAADLRGADLRGLDLAGIDLRDAKLQGADFEAASLRKAKLSGADLSGANLRFADLSNADATAAVLRQADISGAALHATNFFRANLSGASLANSVGPGINLDFADLARADFTGAKITPQLIERGKLDSTVMPNGEVVGKD